MVQVLPPKTNLGSQLGQSIGGGLQSGIQLALQQKLQEQEEQRQMQRQQQEQQRQRSILQEALSQYNPEAPLGEQIQLLGQLPPEIAKNISPLLQTMYKEQQKQGLLNQIFGGQPSGMIEEGQRPSPQQFDPSKITDQQIIAANAVDPQLGARLQQIKELSLRQESEKAKAEAKKFTQERAFHTGFSKELEKEIEHQRTTIPKKEMALDFARNSIETGNVGYLSPDKLADATGIDLFRTAKGAQLITAGKENLLNNMSRVSARAQNIWFEQRLNSMFPKIGQSPEANLTVQEMLEGELSMDTAYVNEFDKLSSEDEQKYGYVRKDIGKRAQNAVKPVQNEILKRTTYRMKEIEENEKGLSKLKNEVGKKVQKGTPLTLAMAKLYVDKFGDNALKAAEDNGYYIPSVEEFRTFQQRPQEFRIGLEK